MEVLRSLIDADSAQLSVRRQCELLGLSRSSLYYEALAETETNLCLIRLIDEQYMATPFYGSRRMAVWLTHEGHAVNRKRVQRLMQLMDLEAIYPKPRLSLGEQRTPEIPVLASWFVNQSCESSVVHGYHVRADVAWIHVPGGCDRLAQPVRPVLGIVEQPGEQFLYRGIGGCVGVGMPGDLQHRSRRAIHESNLHRPPGGSWCGNQYGWSRSGFG